MRRCPDFCPCYIHGSKAKADYPVNDFLLLGWFTVRPPISRRSSNDP
jgi:hypothetical protein